MSFEDNNLNDSFNVESFSEFYNDNIQDEYDNHIMRKYLKPCSNCGELVSKKNLTNGICNCCNTSNKHLDYRTKSINANKNLGFIDNLLNNNW